MDASRTRLWRAFWPAGMGLSGLRREERGDGLDGVKGRGVRTLIFTRVYWDSIGHPGGKRFTKCGFIVIEAYGALEDAGAGSEEAQENGEIEQRGRG